MYFECPLLEDSDKFRYEINPQSKKDTIGEVRRRPKFGEKMSEGEVSECIFRIKEKKDAIKKTKNPLKFCAVVSKMEKNKVNHKEIEKYNDTLNGYETDSSHKEFGEVF